MIDIYEVTIIDVTGVQKFPVISPGKITRNYYSPVTYNIGNYLIKCQSERDKIRKNICYSMLSNRSNKVFLKTSWNE